MEKDGQENQFRDLTETMDNHKKQSFCRAPKTGCWLTTQPSTFNGTTLTREEFVDGLHLRYGFTPPDMPEHCDGCYAPFTIEHALSCRKGAAILNRHNHLTHEWESLCKSAFSPGSVTTEPFIYSLKDRTSPPTSSATRVEARGDVAVFNFWQRGTTAIFDVHVTDTNSPSYKAHNPLTILARQEKAKKDKYVQPCIERRRQFTPLVFSVDGLVATEAEAACKHLAAKLAEKWKEQYSVTCGYVRSKIGLALIQASSLCIRGIRECRHQSEPLYPIDDGNAMRQHELGLDDL